MISPENLLTLVMNLQRLTDFVQDKRSRLAHLHDRAGADVDSVAEQRVIEGPWLDPIDLDKAA